MVIPWETWTFSHDIKKIYRKSEWTKKYILTISAGMPYKRFVIPTKIWIFQTIYLYWSVFSFNSWSCCQWTSNAFICVYIYSVSYFLGTHIYVRPVSVALTCVNRLDVHHIAYKMCLYTSLTPCFNPNFRIILFYFPNK